MTDSITITKFFRRSAVDKEHWPLYLVLGLMANAAIWGTALLFLKVQQPTYSSTLTATLPGSGSAANVNLPDIGQASYENSSPYANSSIQDPRETYKVIAASEPVTRVAANQLNMSEENFGQPQSKIVPNTTIMTFEFKGARPEEARNKSLAFYQALQARLNELRVQEVAQRNVGLKADLGASQKKLEIAQKRLSDYKARSGLSSNEQLRDLSVNIEELRRERAEILAQQQQASTRLRQLAASLNLSDQQATDAFVLQTDQIFQQNLKEYSETSAALVVLESKFLPNHPAVIAQKAKRDAAQIALLTRSQSLLGRQVSQATIQQFNLSSTNSGSAREKLFQELVTTRADQQGIQAQAQQIDRQITQLESRLKTMAQQESTLDALKRDVQIAEAVFSSTLTKLDIGRSNGYGSYPLIQMLAEPSLAETPSSPKKKFVLLGAALGSLFLTTGLVSLWLRKCKTGIPEQIRPLRSKTTQ